MDIDMDTDEFELNRRHLFAIAYRMLGSAAEADDAVQETYLRWQAADHAAIESPRAWLTTVLTRHCLDQLKSARYRREVYVGPWLPEPISTDDGEPKFESLSLAFLVLLETLSPAERAAYLLHEIFDYSHAEVAQLLHKSEEACRQLHHRARAHIVARRPRFAATKEQHGAMLGRFLQAASSGDLSGLTSLLAEDAVTHSDGGGKVPAARKPVRGSTSVARLFIGLARKGAAGAGGQFELVEVNGWPALVQRVDGQARQVLSIETDGKIIYSIHVMANPDKLRHV